MQKLCNQLGATLSFATSLERVVTLPDSVKEKVGIPVRAKTFFWTYAQRDYNGQKLDKVQLEAHGFVREEWSDHLVQFLRKGGFCYNDSSGCIVGVLAHSPAKSANALQFKEPVAVPAQACKELQTKDFQDVSSVLLRGRGALTYAWYPPKEKVAGFEIGGDHGAFVYKMKEGEGPQALMFAVT